MILELKLQTCRPAEASIEATLIFRSSVEGSFGRAPTLQNPDRKQLTYITEDFFGFLPPTPQNPQQHLALPQCHLY